MYAKMLVKVIQNLRHNATRSDSGPVIPLILLHDPKGVIFSHLKYKEGSVRTKNAV